MFRQLYSSLTEKIDRRVGWDKLPWPLGMLVLLGLRFRLRAKNLYDSGRGVQDVPPAGDEWHVDHLTARTVDGTYNDLEQPLMGGLGSRFGSYLLQAGFKGRYDHIGTYREGSGGLWQQMGHQGLDPAGIAKAVQALV